MEYNIPLFKLNFDEKEEQAAVDVIRSKWISSGPKCAELEEKFAKMLGAKYAVAVANCTDALHLGMLVVGVKPGDEVIVPSLTFVATANAVRYTGATPVFADIESLEQPTISPASIEKAITEKTTAIAVMHYAGFACDMDAICDIAKRHNLKIVEDACHGPMSEYKGRKLGTIGDVSCYSFFSNKNISTGEGGMLVTNDEDIYNKAKLMRSHGMTTMSYDRAKGHSTSYDVVELGYNYRMDDIRAAIGISQLDKLVPDIEKREKVREKYVKKLSEIKNVIIPFVNYTDVSSSYIFPIVIEGIDATKRDEIRDALAKKGVQTSVHYPAVHRFEIYKSEKEYTLPITEKYCDTEITLPMYGSLTDDELNYIVESVEKSLIECKVNE